MVNEIRQGDVYWFDFGPADGSTPAEKHPCVVVQSNVFNRSRIATTIVCVITSNLNRAMAPGNVVLRKSDIRLPRPSVVNVSQVTTVNKAELDDRIGKISHAALASVLAGLQLIFERE